MKKVFALLLLALVMCQCNFGSSDQPAKNSLRDQYPEKFTEEYIADRAMSLGGKLCNCDPYNVYAFNNVFTTKYGDILKEALALPLGFNEDYNLVWIRSFSKEMQTEAKRILRRQKKRPRSLWKAGIQAPMSSRWCLSTTNG